MRSYLGFTLGTLICFGFGQVTSTVMTERLSIALGLRENPTATPAILLSKVKTDLPLSQWGINDVTACANEILGPIIVPLWLHEVISRYDTLSMTDYKDPQFIDSIVAAIPSSSSPMYPDRESLTNAVFHWTCYCVNRSRLFRGGPPCTPHVVGGVRYMKLSRSTTYDYLDVIILQLYEEAKNTTPAPTTTLAPTTSSSSTSSQGELFNWVVQGLNQNYKMTIPELTELVNRSGGARWTQDEVKAIQLSIMSQTKVSTVLHRIMWNHRDNCSKTNASLVNAMAQSTLTQPLCPYVSTILPLWNRYCIQPMKEYNNRIRGNGAPTPCAYDPKENKVVLSEAMIHKYLRDLQTIPLSELLSL
jgi:hypothetical protein